MSLAALPYQEPSINTVLILSSFLFTLNAVNYLLNRWIYCGLLGQILIGIVWGNPGFGWLSRSVQEVVMQFGYLGLVLLVYEGGLITSSATLQQGKILLMSTVVAITGIVIPIGLSFAILPALLADASGANAGLLQAFAAGASLCSTSLGTTFTVLSTTGLARTRLGTVLTSAAMLDDVVGLVMVQVISNLGRLTIGSAGTSPASTGSTSGWATLVVRPILVSVAFVVAVVLGCRFAVGMLLSMLARKKAAVYLPLVFKTDAAMLLLHMCFLLGMVAASSYAGTSNLFAAYLAGVAISWADAKASSLRENDVDEDRNRSPNNENGDGSATGGVTVSSENLLDPRHADGPDTLPSGLRIYERIYAQPLRRILQPLFFASIGFSIPIRQMFRGSVVWKGIVYAMLMALAKLATGIWLIRIVPPAASLSVLIKSRLRHTTALSWIWPRAQKSSMHESKTPVRETESPSQTKQQTATTTPTPKNPISLYPASVLGMAMVARGEIGYLIASLAESRGIFSDGRTHSEIYLVVIWAISLCTLVAPVSVGLVVRRIKKLKDRRDGSGGAPDPLGIWGI